MKCNVPNIKSLNPHPAKSYGRTTRASVAALLGGFLPTCLVPNCYHNRIKLENPFFLTDLKKKTEIFLYVPNGWIMEFLKPFMPGWLWNKMVFYNKNGFNSEEMIKDFLNKKPENYFAYFHIMETHPPFFTGTGECPRGEEFTETRRKAVEYVDKIIKPLIEIDGNVIVTSDHALGHNAYNYESGLDVFIATNL
jgi:hypothetical protein